MLTSAKVKNIAKECGADIVGIASMDRFEGAPKQMDPRYIFPDAKSMIVMGFRILRGALRGIEEGTFFSTYSSMGYASINKIYQPMTLWNLCKVIEDNGYEAVPIPNQFPWTNTDSSGKNPDKTGLPRPEFSKPVSPEKPAPDVFVHLRIAAFCAGLGEIGYSKMFLTPEFGPRQRLAAVITDMPLDSDPVMEPGTICDRCMACVKDCTGQCISSKKTVKITLAGKQVEWGEIDFKLCSRYFCGASKEYNPFMVTPEDEKGFAQDVGGGNYKIGALLEHGRALEGARGCIRACMVHLEQRGKLKNKFVSSFRRSKPWKLAR